MKKLKYLLLCMISLLVAPSIIKAESVPYYYTPYKVGDAIIVYLNEAKSLTGTFRVIEASAQGTESVEGEYQKGTAEYQYVTAIYDGNLGLSKFAETQYSNVPYATSLAHTNLLIKSRDAGWTTYESIRLLKPSEIVSGAAWVKSNAPYWLDGIITSGMVPCPTGMSCTQSVSYWQQIVNSEGIITTSLLSADNNLRPVIKIHKGFISGGMICNCDDCEVEEKVCPNDPTINIQACIDGGKTEAECITKLCPVKDEVENPKTGLSISVLGITGLLVVSTSLYLVSRKKNYFSK